MAKRKTVARRAGHHLKKKSCGHYTCGDKCQVTHGTRHHIRPRGERGQGISLNTIIIAVLGLIVLVVLIVIFTGQTGKFTKGTGETMTVVCPENNWKDSCSSEEQPFYGVTDPAQLRANVNKVCCSKKT